MLYGIWDDLTESWETDPMTKADAESACAAYAGGGHPVLAGYGGEYTPLTGRDLTRALKAEAEESARIAKRQALLGSFGVRA